MSGPIVERKDGVPIKMWTRGVPVEEEAMNQLRNVARLPFIHKHVAVMPDVHWGMGATIGSVVATRGAIVPAAVGVDIGCGMMAERINVSREALESGAEKIRAAIEAAIPVGRTDNGQANDKGAHQAVPALVKAVWSARLEEGYERIVEESPNVKHRRPVEQLGTLGTGNHFIEVCLDESDAVWIMLHSGSRGAGNTIGSRFISEAKALCERYYCAPPDKNLAWLPDGTPEFDRYMFAVKWAQEYARISRELMMRATKSAIANCLDQELFSTEAAIDCHHNYVDRENHFGANVWVTRKGAVRAREGDLGIIPGSMGARSFIVRGKGCKDAFHSCSHGAGRAMSRRKARESFSLEDHAKATEGIACRKDAEVLDETPGAYKDIDAVMAAQGDLVEVVHMLRQVVCVKG